MLRASDARLTLSAVSVWELRLKWGSFYRSGRRKGPADPLEVLRWFEKTNVTVLAISPEHAVTPLNHPLSHKDPFDELLLVQAQVEGLRLLTRDARLIGHPLALTA